MKLLELIDFNPKKSDRSIGHYSRRMQARTNSQHLGSGSFGMAFDVDSPKRLNQVTKIGRAAELVGAKISPVDSIEKDGYLSYLKAVYDYEKKGKKNPYFPVIHDLKIIKGDDNKLYYRANLERLVNFDSEKIVGNKELLNAIYEHMFTTRLPYEMVPQEIVRGLRKGLTNLNVVEDPELAAALETIDYIIKNGNFMADLYPHNLMWRITGTMPHLVILDPIA